GIALRLRLGVVQQRQRRQAAGMAGRTGEQRDLGFAMGTVAFFHRQRRRLDAQFLALGAALLLLAPGFLALGLGGARQTAFAGTLQVPRDPAAQRQHAAPDAIHQREPRQPGSQSDAEQQQAEREQAGTEGTESTQQRGANQLSEQATGADRQALR